MSIHELHPCVSRRVRSKTRPPMPRPGPIDKRPFDVQEARDAAADAAFEQPHTPRASAS